MKYSERRKKLRQKVTCIWQPEYWRISIDSVQRTKLCARELSIHNVPSPDLYFTTFEQYLWLLTKREHKTNIFIVIQVKTYTSIYKKKKKN